MFIRDPYANRGWAPSRWYHPGLRDPRTVPPANYNHWPVRYVRMYPQSVYPIHPVLAMDTTRIQYDVRQPPSDSLFPMVPQLDRTLALPSELSAIHIVSTEFLWSLDIPAPVTCTAVFEGLYAMLQKPMADSEWGSICDDSRSRAIKNAAKARTGRDGAKVKRIDWLGDKTSFKGLKKDSGFAERRLMPGMAPYPETWVVKFARP
ncbi:hypothetical protein EDC04DRAFT_2600268 [Pisolithus marmoratus]|nr:hypothetical protein EDC04DRAFT_2600268 [Pisolithus marmoratus]